MAIGLQAEGEHDEGEVGVMLPGHLFPLLLGCGTKRRAEDSLGLGILDVRSPGLGILDIRSYKHIHGEAIIPDADLDFGWFVAFPDELETVPAAPSAEAAPESNASALALDFASNHAKRAKRAAAPASSSGPESSLSRTSSTNTTLSTVHSFLCDSDTPEPPPRSPSSMSPEKTPRAAEAQNLDAAAEAAAPEAAAAEAADAAEDTNRGVNTRKNPQMQKTARDGQRHWHDKVQEMRIQYDLALTGMVHPQFAEQRFMCTVRNLKCQKESLLMFLQFALQQRLLTPLPFVHPSDENSSFLGWTGFQINPGCGPRFRAGVESLFPETPKLNTLYHLFRRSGLVPEDWRRAWEGEIPFLWNPARTS